MSEKMQQLQNLLLSLIRWEERIEAALQHGRVTHTFDDIVTMVLQGRVLFYSYPHAFLVMEKVDYPQFSVFHCFLAGGELEAVMEAQTQMEEIGINLGCKYLSIAGRKGWEKELKARGWDHVCTTLYCPIGGVEDERRRKGWQADLNSGASERRH